MWGFFLCRITGWVVDSVEVPGEEGVSFISSEEMLTLEQHILKFIEICICIKYLSYLKLRQVYLVTFSDSDLPPVKKKWGFLKEVVFSIFSYMTKN
jgi:hypothetical protein